MDEPREDRTGAVGGDQGRGDEGLVIQRSGWITTCRSLLGIFLGVMVLVLDAAGSEVWLVIKILVWGVIVVSFLMMVSGFFLPKEPFVLTDEGMVARGLLTTATIPWEEVISFSVKRKGVLRVMALRVTDEQAERMKVWKGFHQLRKTGEPGVYLVQRDQLDRPVVAFVELCEKYKAADLASAAGGEVAGEDVDEFIGDGGEGRG